MIDVDSTKTGRLHKTKIELNEDFLTYPDSAYQNNIQGSIHCSVYIDSNCTIDSVVLHNKLGYGLDECAILILKNLYVKVFLGKKESSCNILEQFSMNSITTGIVFLLEEE